MTPPHAKHGLDAAPSLNPVVTDEMVERGARAIALAERQDPDDIDRAKIYGGHNNEPRPLWEFYAEQARAAIEAALGVG